jgi:hypothetical protein
MSFINEKTGKKATDELVVFPGGEAGDPDGIGVLVTPEGEVTNRWGDGTAGIPELLSNMAEEETEAYDPSTHEPYTWRHPKPGKTSKHKSQKAIRTNSQIGGIR